MARLARALALLLCCAPMALRAEDSAGSNDSPGDQLKAMRRMLEQQSKQLDVLAQEIARLNLTLESKTPTTGETTPGSAEAAGAGVPPVAKAIPLEDQSASKAASQGPVHIVTKGETLTAIAKRYKVTVPELLKVNKIADVRRLQIGQTVALPPNAKIPASPSPSPQP